MVFQPTLLFDPKGFYCSCLKMGDFQKHRFNPKSDLMTSMVYIVGGASIKNNKGGWIKMDQDL